MATTRSARSIRLGGLRWLVVAGVFALVAAACGDDAEVTATPAPTTTPSPTTTAAPTTTATATTTAAPTANATFDGEECTYSGPASVSEDDVETTFENNSDADAALAFLVLVDESARDAEVALIGTRASVGGAPPGPATELAGLVQAGSGEEATQTMQLASGTYLLDCVTFSGGAPDEVWRVAVLEVDGQLSPGATEPATALDPVSVVEAHYAAWNRGDWDAYVATLHEDAFDTSDAPPGETRIFFDYEVALGMQIETSNCEVSESVSGEVVTCQLVLSNDFYKAADANPAPAEKRLVVSDGKILLFPRFNMIDVGGIDQRLGVPHGLPVSADADSSFNDWARTVNADDFATACGNGGYPTGFRVECAQFRLANVAEWAPIWHAESSG